jgi:hypothetical protein
VVELRIFLALFLIPVVMLLALHASEARAGNVVMWEMPGTGKSIPMPAPPIYKKAERLLASGDITVVYVSAAELRKKCRVEGYLLGCTSPMMCSLGIVYVKRDESKLLRRKAAVHEAAHCLGWDH